MPNPELPNLDYPSQEWLYVEDQAADALVDQELALAEARAKHGSTQHNSAVAVNDYGLEETPASAKCMRAWADKGEQYYGLLRQLANGYAQRLGYTEPPLEIAHDLKLSRSWQDKDRHASTMAYLDNQLRQEAMRRLALKYRRLRYERDRSLVP